MPLTPVWPSGAHTGVAYSRSYKAIDNLFKAFFVRLTTNQKMWKWCNIFFLGKGTMLWNITFPWKKLIYHRKCVLSGGDDMNDGNFPFRSIFVFVKSLIIFGVSIQNRNITLSLYCTIHLKYKLRFFTLNYLYFWCIDTISQWIEWVRTTTLW